MSEYLVLTAMGPDRTGCVSELTKLASECECNIVDSRMAIFGSEFSLIMLLNGDARAINRIEVKLTKVARNLELTTMMKRTSGHRTFDLVKHYQAEFTGIDQPGILKAMTAFFAKRKIDISSLKSQIDPKINHMSGNILFALTEKISIDELEHEFLELCQQTNVQGCIKKANANLL